MAADGLSVWVVLGLVSDRLCPVSNDLQFDMFEIVCASRCFVNGGFLTEASHLHNLATDRTLGMVWILRQIQIV
jgi:hypothetical protein